jgi:hypothetical protein
MRFLLLFLWIFLLIPAIILAQPAPITPAAPSIAPPAAAAQPVQSGNADWSRVGALVHDQPIVVSASGGRTLHCLYTGATDASLFCEPPLYRQYDGEYHVDRADIEQVRLNQTQRNLKIVIWSLVAAGAALGAADPHTLNRDAPRLAGGLVGAAGGAMAGVIISFPVALLIPGKLIYRHRGGALPAASPQSTAP